MSKSHPRIKVVVGVVTNKLGQLLVAQRPAHSLSGGYWEFPGGKVERGETDEQALFREMKEEVNLDLISATCFMQFEYESPHRFIDLNIWKVHEFEGEAKGMEGQEIQWLFLNELDNLEMLPANARVLWALKNNIC